MYIYIYIYIYILKIYIYTHTGARERQRSHTRGDGESFARTTGTTCSLGTAAATGVYACCAYISVSPVDDVYKRAESVLHFCEFKALSLLACIQTRTFMYSNCEHSLWPCRCSTIDVLVCARVAFGVLCAYVGMFVHKILKTRLGCLHACAQELYG